jgi:hypothetical protein
MLKLKSNPSDAMTLWVPTLQARTSIYSRLAEIKSKLGDTQGPVEEAHGVPALAGVCSAESRDLEMDDAARAGTRSSEQRCSGRGLTSLLAGLYNFSTAESLNASEVSRRAERGRITI